MNQIKLKKIAEECANKIENAESVRKSFPEFLDIAKDYL
jgi:5-enolpyruvylshikimate-3-phosphate synthase